MNGPEFTLWDRHPSLRDIAFIDFESGGLHPTSFPVQIGWCGLDLKANEMLIRPLPHWEEDDFDTLSVGIHRIEWDYLLAHGRSAFDVARAANAALSGKVLISDAPGHDIDWCGKLFDGVGIAADFEIRGIEHLRELLGPLADPRCVRRAWHYVDLAGKRYPHTHRAGEDCLRLAAQSRALIDWDWAEWVAREAEI